MGPGPNIYDLRDQCGSIHSTSQSMVKEAGLSSILNFKLLNPKAKLMLVLVSSVRLMLFVGGSVSMDARMMEQFNVRTEVSLGIRS
jgi:hypothetical protein